MIGPVNLTFGVLYNMTVMMSKEKMSDSRSNLVRFVMCRVRLSFHIRVSMKRNLIVAQNTTKPMANPADSLNTAKAPSSIAASTKEKKK